MLGAALGQLVASFFADRRHRIEIEQRERASYAQFVAPAASRRLDALETVYDMLQKTIEEKKISMPDYESLRKNLIYIPSSLGARLILSLKTLISGAKGRGLEEAISETKAVQAEIQGLLGLEFINSAVKELDRHVTDEPRRTS